MAKRSFNTFRRTGTTVPRIQRINYEPAQTFTFGALVVLNSNGNVQECSPDPASVTGVALQPAATGPGFDVSDASKVLVTTGRAAAVSVAIADREEEFSARGVNGATDPVTPLQAHIGQQYGVLKTSDGSWAIDFADQANPIVQITDIFVDKLFFACKFLDSVTTLP